MPQRDERDAGQEGDQEDQAADRERAGDALAPALAHHGDRALQRVLRAEALERDRGDHEEGGDVPSEPGQAADDRRDDLTGALAQQGLHDADERADHQLKARPAEDRAEALARGGEALARLRVVALERTSRAGAQRHAEEDRHGDQHVRADHEDHDQQRLAVARVVERDAAADEDQRDEQRRDDRHDGKDHQRAVAANDRPALLRQLPASAHARHGALLIFHALRRSPAPAAPRRAARLPSARSGTGSSRGPARARGRCARWRASRSRRRPRVPSCRA